MSDAAAGSDESLLAFARQGDATAFEKLVSPRRRELFAHCYRLSGSVQDAEDALQESLLAAWRGLRSFEGRSSFRTWLYQVSTHACLRLISRRPARMTSPDHGPPRQGTSDLGAPVPGPVWMEPFNDELLEQVAPADPHAHHLQRESVELAFVAALQHLSGSQRATLILRDVLDYSASETAEMLDITVASANSALQRARQTVKARVPAMSQRAELAALGGEGSRALVTTFVNAWQSRDLPALLLLLTEDARFTMPPLPAWFEGRQNVGRFFAERVFATPWRLVPLRANGQLGFGCYMAESPADPFALAAVNIVTIRNGRIAEICGFLDPAVHKQFGLPVAPAEKNSYDR